jgi:hypothetical protein
LRYHSEIYIHAVKTEGEAAKYIRHVTEAIHEAHGNAVARAKAVPKRRRVIENAAVADERGEKKRGGKKPGGKPGKK